MTKFQWTKQQLSPVIFSMRKLSDMLTKGTDACYIEGCKVFQDQENKLVLKFLASDINGNLRTLFLKGLENETFRFDVGNNTPPRLAKQWKEDGLNIAPSLLKKELAELFDGLTNLGIPVGEISWDTLASVSTRLSLKKVTLNKAKNEYSLVFE